MKKSYETPSIERTNLTPCSVILDGTLGDNGSGLIGD